ncbi:TetR/AcrR family transcriptional regulator [Frankia sp. CNm7]|uniref:TetR/AcrR family transcriptional regulator n=1 Tax=Frankia nepalensis TaxID=1836974 RepID=A0A937RFX2_9ACTN|nr:TetR/AcrR family transcriptional regulator [Frankia nepalensis]MBL7498476.1 TetR/AcrR family transcriptional regulator [Frankia nepalensis]MBL7509497.1 TetR/AcrR family transcriptional regulator [Frankia nepalensis]MBL7520756.1 TetR/AcrR family transcriptional regulator [Frankia nepalensis]MBL7629307.1 TetR/AcrR family transcriptional regulator [Frankia nepalensis]
MSRRGWGGTPPADDDDARRMIVDAAIRCLDRNGPAKTHLADVATELGVTRQTVYRYFPRMDDLLLAVTERAYQSFIAELDVLFEGVRDPTEFVVEAMAYVIEQLPKTPHLTLLLTAGTVDRFERAGVASAVIARNVRVLRDRTDVDWSAAGYGERELYELVEVMQRLIQSMVVAPSERPRVGAELRAFLRRWIGPAVVPAR